MFDDEVWEAPLAVLEAWTPPPGPYDPAPSASERLAAALLAGPGPVAGTHLAGIDPTELLAGDKVRLVQAWEAQAAHAQARGLAAVAALDSPHPDDEPRLALDPRFTDVEVRAALRLSPGAASDRVGLARDLARAALRPTREALTGGRISLAHAAVLSAGLGALDDPAAVAAVQEQVLPKAEARTPAATRKALDKAVLTLDPAAARARHDRARANRSVRVWPLPDGMAALHVEAPAEQVQHAFTVLTQAATRGRPAGSCADGVDARRADLALAAVTALAGSPSAPNGTATCPDGVAGPNVAAGCPGTPATGCPAIPSALGALGGPLPASRRPRVLVTVAMSTLLGCDDLPAHLAGHGWITAEAARRIATDATWQRLLTDPLSGRVLDHGRTTYRPPRDLADHVERRDHTCRAPHCPRPATQCDLDHVVPYDNGGTTSATNLRATCRHDHRAKTTGGWQVHASPDGTTTWTSPRGITHHVPPDDHLPETRPLDQPDTDDEPDPPY